MSKHRTTLLNITDPNSMAAYMLRYIEWMTIKNYPERTISTKRHNMHMFNQWCEQRQLHRAQDITKPILERYQRYLFYYRKANGKPLGFGRQKGLVVSLKGFFKWCAVNNHILYNPASDLEYPKQAKRLPRDVLTIEEITTMLNLPDIHCATGLRDRALLEILYATGIRRAEIATLDMEDINQQQGTLFVNQGKGKKDRVVPIGEQALLWINKYRMEARESLSMGFENHALFLSAKGYRMGPGGIGRLVSGYMIQANITKSGACHLFRHTLATTMLENGAEIRYIQEMLGHAKLETTQIYTHVTITKLKEIYNATHPAARLKKHPERQKTPER